LLTIACLVVPAWFLTVISHTFADPDLWGHLRFGVDVLAGHGLTSADPYSFTADTPWVNHEWLAEVILAGSYLLGGALGANFLKTAIIGGIGWLLWRNGERAGGSRFALIMLVTLGLGTSYTRMQSLRPQLFSTILFTILLTLLQSRADGNRRAAFAIPVVFCVWANMHGAWIVGFATLGMWLGAEVLETRQWQTLVRDTALLAVSGAATLANPYGIGNWTFLRQTVGLSRDEIADWMPFTKMPLWLMAFELVLPLLVLMALRRARRRPTLRQAAIVTMLGFAVYRVGRVDAFLQIAICFLFTPLLAEAFGQIGQRLATRPLFSTPKPVYGFVAAAISVLAVAGAASRIGHVYIEGDWTPDPAGMRYLREHSPNSRVLTWFDWGEYAIWHLSPAGIRVSMDGRRETVYSDRVLADHWSFYRADAQAGRYPDTIGADQIWLPKNLPAVAYLRTHGWHAIFESPDSVVFSRDAQPEQTAQASKPERDFFPGS